MAVQLGATLVDGFEVSSIREEGGVVTAGIVKGSLDVEPLN